MTAKMTKSVPNKNRDISTRSGKKAAPPVRTVSTTVGDHVGIPSVVLFLWAFFYLHFLRPQQTIENARWTDIHGLLD